MMISDFLRMKRYQDLQKCNLQIDECDVRPLGNGQSTQGRDNKLNNRTLQKNSFQGYRNAQLNSEF